MPDNVLKFQVGMGYRESVCEEDTLKYDGPSVKDLVNFKFLASEARKAVGLSRSLAIRQLSVCV